MDVEIRSSSDVFIAESGTGFASVAGFIFSGSTECFPIHQFLYERVPLSACRTLTHPFG